MSSFQKYYADEDYKKRHLEYMQEKVVCTCNKKLSRGNLNRHLQSTLHANRMKQIENTVKRLDQNRLDEIENQLSIVNDDLHSKVDDDRLLKIEERLASIEKKLRKLEK